MGGGGPSFSTFGVRVWKCKCARRVCQIASACAVLSTREWGTGMGMGISGQSQTETETVQMAGLRFCLLNQEVKAERAAQLNRQHCRRGMGFVAEFRWWDACEAATIDVVSPKPKRSR